MKNLTLPSRQQLRKTLRAKRRSLNLREQQTAAIQLSKQLRKHPLFFRSRNIACYLAADGEINPNILMAKAWKMRKRIYLPTLDPFREGHMQFVRYQAHTKLQKNRFGIPEPSIRSESHLKIPSRYLSLVLLPLVGFDEKGGRLGMGGGFYDRTFAFKQQAKSLRPTMLGLAHECQKVPQLPMEVWDINLNYVATGNSLYKAQH